MTLVILARAINQFIAYRPVSHSRRLLRGIAQGNTRTGATAFPSAAATASAIYNAPAGTSVRVWLDRSGKPEAPPPSSDGMILTALVAGITATAGAAAVLILCYLLCRIVLDRHRLARWESAWAAVGPQWTSRR